MSTDKDWERYQSPVDKLGLDERDRYDFQARRYASSFVVVGMVRSGKIIATNPLREPIAIIESLDQLKELLHAERLKSYAWQSREAERRERVKRELNEEDDDLSSIKINL